MPAGQLRNRVTLEKRAQAPSGTYTLGTSFSEVAVVWAKIEASRGSVYAARVQTGTGPTHRITIRHRDATDFDYIFDGTRRFEVKDLQDPDGLRQWLVINAEELEV